MSKAHEALCVHNKKVYTKHVCDVFVSSILQCFRDKYTAVLNTPNRRKGILESFQDALAEVAQWNREKIANEYANVLDKSKCTYFPDLLKATLLLYVKVELNGVKTLPNIKLVVPTPEHFFHKCCIECARELWKVPQLLYHGGRTLSRQTALIACEDMFCKAIAVTLRKSLPLEELIKYTLTEAAKPVSVTPQDDSEEDVEDSEEEESDKNSEEEEDEDDDKNSEEEGEEEGEESEGNDEEGSEDGDIEEVDEEDSDEEEEEEEDSDEDDKDRDREEEEQEEGENGNETKLVNETEADNEAEHIGNEDDKKGEDIEAEHVANAVSKVSKSVIVDILNPVGLVVPKNDAVGSPVLEVAPPIPEAEPIVSAPIVVDTITPTELTTVDKIASLPIPIPIPISIQTPTPVERVETSIKTIEDEPKEDEADSDLKDVKVVKLADRFF